MPPHWQALAVLTVARSSMGYQFQSVASVAPDLVSQLGLAYADLGTLIGLYFLPGLVLAFPGGALGRRFGDARVVGLGLALMAAGGLLSAWAGGFAELAAGRLLAGIGGVLLNVAMAKMVTDWFAGRREIVLAMAVFVNSFPVGMGLATLTLGALAEAAGWAASLAATSGFALAALLVLVLAYAKHPNDGRGAAAGGGGISRREALLVSLAGLIWGVFNGAFAVMFGFAPSFLAAAGLGAAAAGIVTGVATWVFVGSVQAGGVLAQRGARPMGLMAAGALGWAACLAVLALSPGLSAAALVAAGLVMGLPVGVVMALPAQALRPDSRAVGMGIFYTWLYAGLGLMPPAAGWLRDVSGGAAAPLLLIAASVAAMAPLHAVFLAVARRGTP